MPGTFWTAPELRTAIDAAKRGLSGVEVRRHLIGLGYRARTQPAIMARLAKSGVAVGMVAQPWTEAEDAALRDAYASGAALKGAVPNRSNAAVHHRAKLLGLSGSHPAPLGCIADVWTPAEDAQLLALYPAMTVAQIAAKLRRSSSAVRRRAKHLGMESGRVIRPWTPDDTRAVRLAHVYGLSLIALAAALDRNADYVSRQAKQRLGLRFSWQYSGRTADAERKTLTMADILALGGGAVSASRPAWSVLAGVPHPGAGRGV